MIQLFWLLQIAVTYHVQLADVTELPTDISTTTRRRNVRSLYMVVAWAMTTNLTLSMSVRKSASSHIIQACFAKSHVLYIYNY